MPIRCYAQRLLNPFRGVMNIIEYEGAEAVTTDGVEWDIYVRDTELVKDISESRRVQTSDIRYGHWSEAGGLKRGALYPSDDFRLLEHRGAVVYEYLLKHHAEVPFDFADSYELWLLDGAQDQPLALLDSVVYERDIDTDCHIDWRAGLACCRDFTTDTPWQTLEGAEGIANPGEFLTAYINGLAGKRPSAQWFRRHPDGSATGLSGVGLDQGLQERRLPADCFAPYYLREYGHSSTHARLVQEYIHWQAPWLLLLHALATDQRQRFEQAARQHALAVEQQHRLYPEVLDEGAIAAARVEATLRRQQPQRDDEAEALSTYYIELNVTRTN